MIECRTLGPVDVAVGGGAVPAELLWRKHLALLIYLARSPQRTRSRDHLVALLWGEKPESAARHSLNEAMRILRRHAGEDAVATASGQVRLSGEALELDTDRFQQLAEAADWSSAAELVTGEFMEGFGIPDAWDFEEWLSAERREWRRRSVEALLNAARARLDRGEAGAGAELAQRALRLDPLSEAACQAAMLALALEGDRAGALELFREFAERVTRDLGIEAGAEITGLAERVRGERVWRAQVVGPTSGAGAEAGAAGAESRRSPLVGRESELARVLEVWRECLGRGRASVAVLDGDPGTGKTRLVEEILARARLDGARTATVRAVEADLSTESSTAEALLRGGLREGRGSAALAAAGPASALRVALRGLSAETPLAIAIDDAHWADPASLSALSAAVRDLASAPLFVLLSASPHPPREELDELRTRVGRDVPGAVARVGPLDGAALRALARWALPSYAEADLERLSRRIAMDSAGLPLLAIELLHAVALGLDFRATGGAWPEPFRTLDQTLPAELPHSVVAAVRIGYRRLSPAAQRILSAAAILGDRVASALLATATELDPKGLDAGLDELEWQRWLVADPRGYSFAARIVRDVIAHDMLTSAQRDRIMARVAAAATGPA